MGFSRQEYGVGVGGGGAIAFSENWGSSGQTGMTGDRIPLPSPSNTGISFHRVVLSPTCTFKSPGEL